MQFTKSLVSLAAFIAAAAATTGRATFYSPGGEVGACGTAIQNSDLSVALSTEDFSSELCGTEFIVEFNGQGVAVAVADICAACGKGNIDLTTGAYEILAPLDTGAIEVTYEL